MKTGHHQQASIQVMYVDKGQGAYGDYHCWFSSHGFVALTYLTFLHSDTESDGDATSLLLDILCLFHQFPK